MFSTPAARRSALVLATLCLSSCLALQSVAGTLDFVSDDSWTVSAMNSDGTRGALIGAAECYGHPHPGGFVAGACPVWLPSFTVSTPSDLVGGYFSKSLVIPGAPISGSARVAVDDFVEVRINGVVVGTWGSITDLGSAAAAQSNIQVFDVTPFLMSGPNLIEFRAQNGPYWFSGAGCNPCGFSANPCGLIFDGSITYDAPTPANGRSWGSLKVSHR